MARPKDSMKFATPEILWQKACEYFAWCDANPWVKKDFIKGGDYAGTLVDIPVQRPYTIDGLCNFLEISIETFDNYSKEEPWRRYFEVCSRIRVRINTQSIEGGYVGAYNASLVSMKLGMQQKLAIQGSINIVAMSKEEEEELRKAMGK